MKKVNEIMTKDPACCLPSMGLVDVAKIMLEQDCGEIPVINNWKDLRPVGVITDRDIICRSLAQGKNPMQLKVKDCMTAPAITVNLETSIDACCKIMEEEQIRRVPVVNTQGQCCGMISQADIARKEDELTAGELLQRISKPFEKLTAH